MQTLTNDMGVSTPRADLISTPSGRNKVRPFSLNGRELGIRELDKNTVKMDKIIDTNKIDDRKVDENSLKNPTNQIAVSTKTKPTLPVSVVPTTTAVVKEEQIIQKKKIQREENFFCLCKKCNSRYKCETHSCKVCTNTLCGFPMHTCMLFWVIFLGLVGLFLYYLTVFLIFKYTNYSYFATCLSNNDCNTTSGLYCATTAGVCNCPAKNTVGKCDCNKGYYWNGTQCTLLLTYNSTGCVNNYNCDQSKYLVCSNGVCGCTLPKVWTNSTCDYKYIGCYYDSLYLGIGPLWSSQNNNTRMTYVVETCIGYCYNIQFKYALLSIGNFLVGCFCQSNYTASSVLSASLCSTLCPGVNPSGYYCGNPTYTNQTIKAVYQTF